MAQTNNITLRVFPSDDAPEEPIEFEDVNYVSFVSSPGGAGSGTFGIPAILSEERVKGEGLPVRVVYVNPANITAMEAVRNS